MLNITKAPGQRILELGGGESRHPAADCCVDVRPIEGKVDFTADLEKFPWPISDNEWDCVLAQYLLEHITYLSTKQALAEVLRILKPGGRLIAVVPNTVKQIEWLQANQSGWDGKDLFTSASELLFGSQSYNLNDAQPVFDAANVHKSFWSPDTATAILREVGFDRVTIAPYGERQTDMVIDAAKALTPKDDLSQDIAQRQQEVAAKLGGTVPAQPKQDTRPQMTREEMFDRQYFNGGGKVGGYSREGYQDFPCHHITVAKVMEKKPESILEIGCARGYLIKRFQDLGVHAEGMEISKHCYLSRVADGIKQWDICKFPWPYPDQSFDMALSIATMEHVPAEFIPGVLAEANRVCRRGLHGVDFGGADDGFDRTHVSLFPKETWLSFNLKNQEVCDKEELEKGTIPDYILRGDGKVKLNIGSFTTQTYYGWTNIDIHDLGAWSQQHGYRFLRHDVRQGLPFKTGEVHLIAMSHFLEHLTPAEGRSFLRECRRVIHPQGAMRIAVPDAGLLMGMYADRDKFEQEWKDFSEINDGCAAAPTTAGKLWALLHEGHSACYDRETIDGILAEAGFKPSYAEFRKTQIGENGQQLLKETLDMMPCLSLYADATPLVA